MKGILVNKFIAFCIAFSSSIAISSGQVERVLTNSGVHYTGYLGPNKTEGVVYFQPNLRTFSAPAEYDARKDGCVAPTVNQGSCGSCWSFAMTKAHEAAQCVAGKGLLDLSEQDWLVNDRNSYGCRGGYMNASFAVNYGQTSEAECPYRTSDRYACNKPKVAKAVQWGFIGARNRSPTVEELKAAIYQYKVLAVTVAASGGFGSPDAQGNVTRCNSSSVNHMVTLHSYWSDNKLGGRNSWGAGYGDGGDFYSKQGCNKLASGSESALYIVAEEGPAPTPPKIQLPIEMQIYLGTNVALGVPQEANTTYEWSTGETSSVIFAHPTRDTIYTLTAKNSAGIANSSVLVKVVAPNL